MSGMKKMMKEQLFNHSQKARTSAQKLPGDQKKTAVNIQHSVLMITVCFGGQSFRKKIGNIHCRVIHRVPIKNSITSNTGNPLSAT